MLAGAYAANAAGFCGFMSFDVVIYRAAETCCACTKAHACAPCLSRTYGTPYRPSSLPWGCPISANCGYPDCSVYLPKADAHVHA
jgi:hypothetical protein